VTLPATSAPPGAEEAGDAKRAELEQQLRVVGVTARRQIAAGQRQAALDTLSRGLALDANDPEVNNLLDELARVARRAATEAGAAAAKRGLRSSAPFRDAQAREREADSLLRAGDRVPAVQAFWAATSRYNQVPEVTGQRASAAPPPAAPTARAVTPVEPPASPPISPPISTSLPPPPKPVPAPAEKSTAPPPASPKPEVAREPAPDPNAAHVTAIRETLRRYSEAYQSRDSQAVGKMMPSLTPDQLRNLERDFSNYRSYTVDIRDERIAVEGITATVTCQVVRSFETRNGVTGSNAVDSIFHLRRTGSAWTIERLESR
jgi:hypothetical protein